LKDKTKTSFCSFLAFFGRKLRFLAFQENVIKGNINGVLITLLACGNFTLYTTLGQELGFGPARNLSGFRDCKQVNIRDSFAIIDFSGAEGFAIGSCLLLLHACQLSKR
jgi:hypothetical protein